MRLNEKLTNWVVSLLAVVMLAFALGCGGGGGGGGISFLGYTISGKALSSDGSGLSSIDVILSDATGTDTNLYTTKTDSSGNYSFNSLNSGDYYVSAVPVPGSYSFTPVWQEVKIASADISGINFTGYLPLTGETTTQSIGSSGGIISTPGGATATFDPDFLINTGSVTISTYPSDLMKDEGSNPLSGVVEISIPTDTISSTLQAKITKQKSHNLQQETESYITITIPTNNQIDSKKGISLLGISQWNTIKAVINYATESIEGVAMTLKDAVEQKIKIAKSTLETISGLINLSLSNVTIKISNVEQSFIPVPSSLSIVKGWVYDPTTRSKTLNIDEVWNENNGNSQSYSGNKKIIILVHGWQGIIDSPVLHPEKDEGWYYFVQYFFNDTTLRDNFDIFTHRYDSNDFVAQNAGKLSGAIDNYFRNNEEIYLIAHSMGGLVSHTLLKDYWNSAGNRIQKLITLDTPFHGTPLVQIVYQATYDILPILVAFPALAAKNAQDLAWDNFERQPVQTDNKILYYPFAGNFVPNQGSSHSLNYRAGWYLITRQGSIFAYNDGVVPVVSSYFKKDSQNSNAPWINEVVPIFEDYDHSQIRTGKNEPGQTDTSIFDKIKEILLTSTSTNPQFKIIDQFNNPVSGAYLILHNSDGSVEKYATTDTNGMADLGSIAGDHVTMTVTHGGSGDNNYAIWSFVNIPILKDKTNTWRVWNDNPDKLGTINIEIPGYSSGVWLQPFGQEWSSSSKSVDVHVGERQTDGKLSIGAEYYWTPLKYGFLTDQTFQSGSTYTVNLNKDFGQISFTSNIPVTDVVVVNFRKGLNFDIGYWWNDGNPATAGSFAIADQVPADTYIISARYDSNVTGLSANGKDWEKKFASLPNPISINMPDLSVNNVTYNATYDGYAVYWTVSGSAKKDIATVRFEWLDPNSYVRWVRWYVYMDPSNIQWTHNLELPDEVSLWLEGKGLNSIGVSIGGYDSCSGFDDLVRKYLENPNSFSYNEMYSAYSQIWESIGIQSLSKQSTTRNSQRMKGPSLREKRKGFLP